MIITADNVKSLSYTELQTIKNLAEDELHIRDIAHQKELLTKIKNTIIAFQLDYPDSNFTLRSTNGNESIHIKDISIHFLVTDMEKI